MFEAHENENIKTPRATPPPRSGIPRKSSLPRRVGPSPQANARTTVKRSSSLDGKTRPKPTVQKRVVSGSPRQRERTGSDSSEIFETRANLLASMEKRNAKTENKFKMRRSYSDNEITTKKSSVSNLQNFQLRRSNSWTALISQNEISMDDDGKKKNTPSKRTTRTGVKRPRTQPPADSTLNAKPGLRDRKSVV